MIREDIGSSKQKQDITKKRGALIKQKGDLEN
jgi:hypothetical protein